jgi:large subunit ribosomal protein L23
MTAILIQPLLTEKMTELGKSRQYAFEVARTANKIEIAKAVEKKFSVTVTSCRTILYKGKRKAQMTKKGRIPGKRPDWKKALVTLKEGQTIDLLANV